MNKKLTSAICWILYIAILIGLIYGIPKIMAYFLKTDYPMASITSGSMWPSLKKGDLILIKGVEDKSEIKVGDIIIYQNPPSAGSGQVGFTIHRVVEINEDSIVTKGDANNVNDAPVRYEEIIGKTVNINNKPLRIPFVGMIGILINKR